MVKLKIISIDEYNKIIDEAIAERDNINVRFNRKRVHTEAEYIINNINKRAVDTEITLDFFNDKKVAFVKHQTENLGTRKYNDCYRTYYLEHFYKAIKVTEHSIIVQNEIGKRFIHRIYAIDAICIL